MYNESVKNRFISEHTDSVATASSIRRVFQKIEDYEEAIGADICTMDMPQLQKIIDAISGISASTRASTSSYLRMYGKWCLDNHIPGAKKDLTRIKMSGTDAVYNKMVAGPMDLQNILDSFLLPESELTVDNIYRAYCWFVFAGLRNELVDGLTKDNVDFDNMEIVVGDFHGPLYKQALPCLENVVYLDSFRYIHPNYAPVMRKRYASNHILRAIKGDASYVDIQKKLNKNQRDASLSGSIRSFTYTSLRKSGIFYRYFLLEREMVAEDFTKYALDYIDPGMVKSTAQIYPAVRSLHEDYKLWKDAFRV